MGDRFDLGELRLSGVATTSGSVLIAGREAVVAPASVSLGLVRTRLRQTMKES